MIFTIIDRTKKVDINKEVNKITKVNDELNYKEYYDGLDFEIVFLYGGDGTYIEYIKNNIKRPIKIILMSFGKLSFLNSSYNYEPINLNNFKNINYLEYFDNTHKMNIINECEIIFDRLNEFKLYVNEVMFKEVISSRFFTTTTLGSTGLARSRNYPILLDSNSYIFHILDEPKYKYYNSLSQPLLLSTNDNIKLEFKQESDFMFKIDNGIILKSNSKKITIKNLVSSCLIYNAYDIISLSKKIGELF